TGSLARHHSSPGALRRESRIVAGQAHLEATFVDVTGKSIDSFEIVRSLPPSAATGANPPAPKKTAPEKTAPEKTELEEPAPIKPASATGAPKKPAS
ncbi:MAG: hypothetical protein ACKOGA_19195, partial [Planctomycetaceae bacterium]